MNVHIHAVPRHISAPDELWPDTSMSLVNNNIIMIVSTRLIGENTQACACSTVVGEAK